MSLLFSSRQPGWRKNKWFELASHFRVQYVWLALVCAALSSYGHYWWLAGVAAALAILNLYALLPQFRRTASPSPNSTNLKIILFNVEHRNEAFTRTLNYLSQQQADLIVVQEVTAAWVAALEPLRAQLPFAQTVAAAAGSGLALYSRWPFANAEMISLTNDERPALEVTLQIHDTLVSVLTIHPRAPLKPGHYELRNAMLKGAAARMQTKATPKLLIGDLNTTNWSPFFSDLLQQTELRDARHGQGILATWPVQLRTRWLMIPIDHCLVSTDIGVKSVRTGPRLGSDHLPLIITLAIPTLATAAR